MNVLRVLDSRIYLQRYRYNFFYHNSKTIVFNLKSSPRCAQTFNIHCTKIKLHFTKLKKLYYDTKKWILNNRTNSFYNNTLESFVYSLKFWKTIRTAFVMYLSSVATFTCCLEATRCYYINPDVSEVYKCLLHFTRQQWGIVPIGSLRPLLSSCYQQEK